MSQQLRCNQSNQSINKMMQSETSQQYEISHKNDKLKLLFTREINIHGKFWATDARSNCCHTRPARELL